MLSSWLVSSFQDKSLGSELWLGTICCVLMGKALLSVPLSTKLYKWVLANLMLRVTLPWTSIPSMEEYK